MSTPQKRKFNEFKLNGHLLEAIGKLGFVNPTPIQAESIPVLLEGKSIVGRARTGSGKTAAFGIPLLNQLAKGGGKVRGLILCPTRELAIQVSDALQSFCHKKSPIKILSIYGGSPYPPQLRALKNGVDIVVGTPGRVIDHMERGSLDVSGVDMFILDEADEMLRMGFIEEVERIFERMPNGNQVALFSATMPRQIQRIANKKIPNHVVIQVEEDALTTKHITQKFALAPRKHKLEALMRILQTEPIGTTLVFANTRRDCADVSEALVKKGFRAEPLHGDMDQPARERVLNRLKSGALQLVVATDVASRGIDVEHINYVINLEVPTNTESYVHRIGRTARAGRSGTAITLADPQQSRRLHYMQKELKVEFEKLEIPSDKMIATAQRRALWDELLATMEDGDFADARGWVDSMLKEDDGRDFAAAAIALLARAKGMRLNKTPDAEAPAWTKINARANSSSSDGRRRRGPRGRSDKRRSRGPNSRGSGGSQGPSKGPSKSRPRRG